MTEEPQDVVRTDVASAVEALLVRIPSVTAARAVAGPGAHVSEVHLVADRSRAPKQIVRDVQTAVLADLGIEIDYRIVSVVQLDDFVPAAPATAAPAADVEPKSVRRVELLSVTSDVRSAVTEVRIGIVADEGEFGGSARGPSSAWERLVARAVVDAVQPLTATVPEVEEVRLVDGDATRVAVVVLRLPSSRGDHVVTGAAPVRGDVGDAIARATLGALNRFLRVT